MAAKKKKQAHTEYKKEIKKFLKEATGSFSSTPIDAAEVSERLGACVELSQKHGFNREAEWFVNFIEFVLGTGLSEPQAIEQAGRLLEVLEKHTNSLPKGSTRAVNKEFSGLEITDTMRMGNGLDTNGLLGAEDPLDTARELLANASILSAMLKGDEAQSPTIVELVAILRELKRIASDNSIVIELNGSIFDILENARRSGAALGSDNALMVKDKIIDANDALVAYKPEVVVKSDKKPKKSTVDKPKKVKEKESATKAKKPADEEGKKPKPVPLEEEPKEPELVEAIEEDDSSLAEALFGDFKPDAIEGPERETPDKVEKGGEKRDGIRAEMLDIFIQEADDLLDELNGGVLLLENDPEDEDINNSVMRSAHTLKGAAAMLGFNDMSQVAKAMEDILVFAEEHEFAVSEAGIDLLFALTDTAAVLLSELTGGPQVDRDAISVLLSEKDRILTPMIEEYDEKDALAAVESKELSVVRGAMGFRVDPTRLDTLLNLAGELVIARTRLNEIVARLSGLSDNFNRNLGQLETVSTRFGVHTTGVEGAKAADSPVISDFSASEFDRFTEYDAINRDIQGLSVYFENLNDGYTETAQLLEDRLIELSLIANRIQDEVKQVRMIPFGNVATRFRRAARDMAKYYNKQITFQTEGGDTEIDKKILDNLLTPITHIIRNSVAHGIETRESRIALGKPIEGTIRLQAYQIGNSVVIEVYDDGAGIKRSGVEARAREMGSYTTEELRSMDDSQVYRLILLPGFSTSEEVTEASGRGFGLNVVEQRISSMKGSLEIETEEGEFSKVILRLPLTVGISVGLFVTVANQTFAIPLVYVDETLEFVEENVSTVSRIEVYLRREEFIPILRLGSFFGANSGSNSEKFLVIVHSAGRLVGLAVDGLLGKEEMVVKPTGDFLKNLPNFGGATTLGDGSVSLILDPDDLTESIGISTGIPKPRAVPKREIESPVVEAEIEELAAAVEEIHKDKPEVVVTPDTEGEGFGISVLLVDDSVSIRNFVGRFLARRGFDVETAADGEDALRKIQAADYDLVLTDLEMPRMHGYELISEIKSDTKTRHLPVMVLTARTAEKHKRRAQELGVEYFHTKPFNEDKLVEDIIRLIKKRN